MNRAVNPGYFIFALFSPTTLILFFTDIENPTLYKIISILFRNVHFASHFDSVNLIDWYRIYVYRSVVFCMTSFMDKNRGICINASIREKYAKNFDKLFTLLLFSYF